MKQALRFKIKVNRWLAPLFALFGGTPGRSFAEISENGLRLKFGWLFDYRFPLNEVETAEGITWPWILGIGWRATLTGRIGLIGSLSDVVEIRLMRPRRVWMLIPWLPCDRIAVSLEQPEEFLAALKNMKP